MLLEMKSEFCNGLKETERENGVVPPGKSWPGRWSQVTVTSGTG